MIPAGALHFMACQRTVPEHRLRPGSEQEPTMNQTYTFSGNNLHKSHLLCYDIKQKRKRNPSAPQAPHADACRGSACTL